MKTWLHFVGRQYYSRAKFIREAKRYGVTRRVSLQQLKKMAFGDRVLLAMLEGKSPVVFGSFVIEKISGLSPVASVAIREKFQGEQVSAGGGLVIRGCGTYIEGRCFVVSATLQDIVGVLEELKDQEVDVGLPMVGGRFEHQAPIRLKDVPFRQGFREFDYARFISELDRADKLRAVVRGQFYVDGEQGETGDYEGGYGGYVEEVRNYQRKGVS